MFSKEGRCTSHYNTQNPIKLGKRKNTETKFDLLNKISELNRVVHSMFRTFMKSVRDSGEQCSVCMKDGGSQQENPFQQFKFSDRHFMQTMYFHFPASLLTFLFFILECFWVKQNIVFGEYCSKDIISIYVLHPYATGWIFQNTRPSPNSVPTKGQDTFQWIQNYSLLSGFENPAKSCPILSVITLTNKLLLLWGS